MYTFGIVSAASIAEIHENINTITAYAQKAAAQGCTALCFPECFLTGYIKEQAAELAIALDSDACRQLSALAQELNIDLLVGIMEKAPAQFVPPRFTAMTGTSAPSAAANALPNYFITQALFLADGITHAYRKTHLGTREKPLFTAGDALPVFRLTCGVSIGFQICVETHFNDITQTLSLRGADLIFAPHAVPRAAGDRKALWEKYIPARSYDNKVYMACCNQYDEERFGGGLLVTAPTGEIIASSYGSADMILFSVDIPTGKDRHYFPAQRRPELYL